MALKLRSIETQLANEVYPDITPSECAMMMIECYGGIDGAHHKSWVIDQVARILCGTPVLVTMYHYEDELGEFSHTEHRFSTDTPSEQYNQWVVDSCTDSDGELAWDYDCGIAP